MTRPSFHALILFLLLMVAPLPFLPEFGGGNSSTRLMLTNAIVNDGHTRIDEFAHLTPDKAQSGAHYYSDKAPGMALLAIPAFAVGQALSPDGSAALFEFSEPLEALPRSTLLIWRAISWTTGGLLFALAGVSLYRMGLRYGGGPRASLLAVMSVCLATPFFGWSTQFFGHVGAGAALAIAFSLSTGIGRIETIVSPASRVIIAATALSLAVSIEYTAAPPAVLIAIYALWRLMHLSRRSAIGLTFLALLAALVAAAPMLIYHWFSFGSPFRVGYSSVVGFEGMDEGLLGLTLPDPVVLWKILFGFRRGILWLSPLLVLVPLGIFWGLCKPRHGATNIKVEMTLCVAVIAYYFLLNASYYYWAGGASLGPRHTLPALMFVAPALMLLWDQLKGLPRLFLKAMFGLSVFLSFASASVNMTTTRGWFPIIDPILKNVLTDHNVFMKMAHWGLSPTLVFCVWGAATLGLLALVWRGTPARV